jgi:hypothetical protein
VEAGGIELHTRIVAQEVTPYCGRVMAVCEPDFSDNHMRDQAWLRRLCRSCLAAHGRPGGHGEGGEASDPGGIHVSLAARPVRPRRHYAE